MDQCAAAEGDSLPAVKFDYIALLMNESLSETLLKHTEHDA
jgi:hypothetical protein